MTIDTCIFANNLLGIGAYLDDGWAELNLRTKADERSYLKRVPNTARLAETLLGSISERRRWGMQLPHGGWVSYTKGESKGRFLVSRKSTPDFPYYVEPLANSVGISEIRKHLCGRSLSVGTTDRPAVDAYQILEERERYHPISCLRLDTDQNEAWLYEDAESIFAELRRQKRVVESLGLPYLPFKTGGRGFQSLIPLPRPLSPASASLLSRGIRLALRSTVNNRSTVVDKDGFDGLMRLPGGVHRLGNTALFIDVDNEKLYGLEVQIQLVGDLFRGGSAFGGSLEAEEFLRADQSLTSTFRQELGFEFMICAESDVLNIVRRTPKNLLSRLVVRAFEAAGSANPVPSSYTPSCNAIRPVGSLDRRWAQDVWNLDIAPGTFWNWIYMGGERGMLAAVVLFGKDRAVDMLFEKASQHRAVSPTDQREREFVIPSLWKSFELKDFVPRAFKVQVNSTPKNRLAGSALDFADGIADEVKAKAPKSKWNRELLAAILATLVQAITESLEDEISLGLRDIARLVTTMCPDRQLVHMRVQELLPKVCRTIQKGPDYETILGSRFQNATTYPDVEVFVRVVQASAAGEKQLYLPGKRLIAFLQRLPDDGRRA